MISLRTGINLFLIAFCIIVSLFAARYALANFYYERGKVAYSKLNKNQLRYASELSHIVDDIDRSIELRGQSANSLDFKADLLYQSWWLSPDAQYLEDSKLLHAALKYHQQAWQIRPNWAFSAARVALIYSHGSRLDKSFDQWFSLTHYLGLYETKVARSMMKIGLLNWPRLTVKQQELTVDFIRASIEQKSNSTATISTLLSKHGRLESVCLTLKNTERKREVCG